MALHLHREHRTTGLAEQGGEKLGRPSLTLPVVGHQQRGECHQPWPRLALRHARRQLRAGQFTAVSTREPMTPVLGDVRLDLGQFPHLVAERGGVATAKRCPALAALARLELLDLVALAGGHERALVLLVPRLAAPLLLRLRFLLWWLGVRVPRARRQRRVLGRLALPLPTQLVQFRPQPGDFRQQGADDPLSLRRLASNHRIRELRRHAPRCRRKQPRKSRSILRKYHPRV